MKPTFSSIASTAALSLLTLILHVTPAFALFDYGTKTDTFCQTYNGTTPFKDSGYNCAFCHLNGVPPALNSMGQLYKNNGMQPSAAMCPVLNTAPVANAGLDETVPVGTLVTLDGTHSSDVDGNPLTYHWILTSIPTGSGATLSSPTAATPTFTADKAGQYTAQLVVNDGTVDSLPDTVMISTDNTAPVANAGPDQTAAVGSTVTMNGTGSTDADGDALTYQWSFVLTPTGSTASISNPTSPNPTFVADKAGQYVAQLIVNDGTADSLPDTVMISTDNTAPVANAGLDQSVVIGSTVTLNGGGSTDVDGNPLTYDWMFLSVPTGSTASFSNPTAANPTFIADKAGQYVAQLIVNDGTANSLPDTVTITTTGIMNTAPIADAGMDQTVSVGATVQLDGSGSQDADADTLHYKWTLTSVPTGSNATLSDATTVTTSFVADVAGQYVAQLIVNDGTIDSAPDSVMITTLGGGNAMPTADAGPDQKVAVGTIVTLDGSGSHDPEGAALTYQWTLIKTPLNSTASLSNPGVAQPTFKADRTGEYIAQLIVNDGVLSSAPDTVVITTTKAPRSSGVYIQRAIWAKGTAKLMVIGRAPKDSQVAIRDAASGKTLFTVTASSTGRFRAYFTPPFAPCSVIAVADGTYSEKTRVFGTPSNCGTKGGASVMPQESEYQRERSKESERDRR